MRVEFEVWRIDRARDKTRMAGADLDAWPGGEPDRRIYKPVWRGEENLVRGLDDLVRDYAVKHFDDPDSCPITVSDVIGIREPAGANDRPFEYFYVRKNGYRRVNFPEPEGGLIRVLYAPVGGKAEELELANSAEAVENLLGRRVADIPLGDNVTVLCAEKRPFHPLKSNRFIYGERCKLVFGSFSNLADFFRIYEAGRGGREHITGYVLYSRKNFGREYSALSRTYKFDSGSNFFTGAGPEIYGECLDGTDRNIRLDKLKWAQDFCYIYEKDPPVIGVIPGDFIVCGLAENGREITGLDPARMEKYKALYLDPPTVSPGKDRLVAAPVKGFYGEESR